MNPQETGSRGGSARSPIKALAAKINGQGAHLEGLPAADQIKWFRLRSELALTQVLASLHLKYGTEEEKITKVMAWHLYKRYSSDQEIKIDQNSV